MIGGLRVQAQGLRRYGRVASGHEALSLYRALYRTVNIVFEGDCKMRAYAMDKLKVSFDSCREETDEEQIAALLKDGWETNRFFSERVVQAETVEEVIKPKWRTGVKPFLDSDTTLS